MKRIICVLLLMAIGLSFAACSKKQPAAAEDSFTAMNTQFTVRLYGGSEEDAASYFESAHALVNEIEKALSRTRIDSDVYRINARQTIEELSPHTDAVLKLAVELNEATGGTYLPTMGAISDLWVASEKSNTLPDKDTMRRLRNDATAGFSYEDGVFTFQGETAMLDLGGIGKGYAVDCLLAHFSAGPFGGGLISCGSSVAVFGEKGDGNPFTVSIRDPENASGQVGVISGLPGILSVSGNYERYFTVEGKKYHHILDPITGYPSDSGLSSVAVVAKNGAVADALSTAMMVMGDGRSRAFLSDNEYGAEAILIKDDGTLTVSDGLKSIFRET